LYIKYLKNLPNIKPKMPVGGTIVPSYGIIYKKVVLASLSGRVCPERGGTCPSGQHPVEQGEIYEITSN
jgi:hypothetical protein